MPPLLRLAATWIATLCLALNGLWPLSTLAADQTPANAMAICSTAGNGGPGQMPFSNGHLHCTHCSAGQPYDMHLPDRGIAGFEAALLYYTTPVTAGTGTIWSRKGPQWARAPPLHEQNTYPQHQYIS